MLLAGCGGGDSVTTNTTYTFELNAYVLNNCDVKSPFTEIELLVQDDNWQITERHQPDTNGLISFITNDKYINYTLVAKSRSGEAAEGLDIRSYYQANTGTISNYKATYDSLVNNDTCQCITNNLLLNHRSLTTRREAYSSHPFESTNVISANSTQFNNVQVCKKLDGDWPLTSFIVTGESISENLIGAANFLNTFDLNETEDDWILSAIEIPEALALSVNQDLTFTTSQVLENTEHFLIHTTEEDQSILVLNSHNYISEAYFKLNAEQTLATSDTLFSQSALFSINQLVSSSYNEAYDTEIAIELDNTDISLDYINFSELTDDGSFDYSAIDSHPMSIISFTYSVLNNDGSYYPVTWTNYGPNKGVLASYLALVDYQDIVNQETTILENTEVSLLQSINSNNYEDYINFFQQGNSLTENEDIANDFNHNIHIYYLQHKLK